MALSRMGPYRSLAITDRDEFVDSVVSTTPSSTPGRFSLFTPFATLLGSVPQLGNPVTLASNVEWRARIRVLHLEVRVLAIGSQSNTLVAGDLFNNVRFIVAETRDSFGIASIPTLTSVTGPLVTTDKRYIHADHIFNLCSHAFNSAGYNVPDCQNLVMNIPINRVFDWFTQVSTGASGWDTKTGNIEIATVSDSTVTPNPVVNFTTRIYFQVLKNTGRGDGQ